MADFVPAVEKTLAHEGGYVHFPATGEYSNFGISHWFLRRIQTSWEARAAPASEMEIERIKNLPKSAAVELYRAHFWNKNRCGEITDQPLAEKFFDLSVNMGPGQAAKLLQRAVNVSEWPGAHLAEDGAIGPKTIAAVNECEPVDLLRNLKAEAAHFYRNLAASKPVLASNLAGWLARVDS